MRMQKTSKNNFNRKSLISSNDNMKYLWRLKPGQEVFVKDNISFGLDKGVKKIVSKVGLERIFFDDGTNIQIYLIRQGKYSVITKSKEIRGCGK